MAWLGLLFPRSPSFYGIPVAVYCVSTYALLLVLHTCTHLLRGNRHHQVLMQTNFLFHSKTEMGSQGLLDIEEKPKKEDSKPKCEETKISFLGGNVRGCCIHKIVSDQYKRGTIQELKSWAFKNMIAKEGHLSKIDLVTCRAKAISEQKAKTLRDGKHEGKG